ncbi:DUF4376 domain-containing protein [Methylobacterium sp. E-041]|uniref:DUF4376 domain-containing protein n=1 Tax=Methylobacterium sp. E-041 TaxID=2836573 RepID=UPI001FBA9095|nr:DUF4376 domain-containing protein [Methylobacterium sp. E-041]MCJ2108019.1 DUF4376 domain-containing protein [Methylobacterium sp. E-041]
MPRYALIHDGVVRALSDQPDAWPTDLFDVRDVSAVEGVAPGWIAGDGGAFSSPPAAPLPSKTDGLIAYAAAARYAREVGGIAVSGVGIATDRASQTMIANAYAYVQASGAASVEFKAESGWVTLSAEQMKLIALAVGAHVQACYAVESRLDLAISATPPAVTTQAEIDAAFAALT